MKNDRGEISIPQIIIVIVLIVLVGVCIFMLTGENGLFVPKGYEPQENLNNVVNTEEPEEQDSNTNEPQEQNTNSDEPINQNSNVNTNGALVVPAR